MMSVETLILHFAKALVDNPDAVTVLVEEQEDTVHIRLTVDPTDMGRIIGKQGRIANALRTVMKAVGAKANKKVFIEIVE